MKVLKFGGTSLGSSERIRNVVNIISDNEIKIVVFSAIESITNLLSDFIKQSKNENWIISEQLLEIIKEKHSTLITELISSANLKEIALKKLNKTILFISKYNYKRVKIKDEKMILSQGEILSSMIIYIYLLDIGMDAALLPSLDFLRINKSKEPDYSFIKAKLIPQIEKHRDCKLFLTQGFICRDYKNNIDHLGRGGSDYTATIIANALNSNSVEIWTDIDGLRNNDPRFVHTTKHISTLSYDDASELAYFGAKILHPASITPAQQKGIPIRIKNTFNPEHIGTLISMNNGKDLKAIASKDQITTIKVKSARMMQAYGFLRRIFEVFDTYHTSVDMLTSSEISVAMTIEDTSSLNEIVRDLSVLGDIQVEKNQSIICIVGNFSDQNFSIQNIVEGLNSIAINMISFGASKNNMTLVIDSINKSKALNLLNTYILNNEPCLTN
ncbi:MAG TPA: aspartate kinase [Bacteroidales bacterium]|nr:aspartate kinase [Bacteroidales bacterium]